MQEISSESIKESFQFFPHLKNNRIMPYRYNLLHYYSQLSKDSCLVELIE